MGQRRMLHMIRLVEYVELVLLGRLASLAIRDDFIVAMEMKQVTV